MKWWVETFLNTVQDGYSLWVLVKTNYADHLFLSWSYHHPAREPILVVVRGSHKRCGYKYIWDTPAIVEQDTAGDTLVHQFHITSLQAPSHLWFYIWAPDGPYGLEIQSPLHRADLSPVLIPSCSPLWTFDTNLQGWTVELGSVRWANDGSPNPGSIEFYGTGNDRARSPQFDSSWATKIIVEAEVKHLENQIRAFLIDIWWPAGWVQAANWGGYALPWTHKETPDLVAYKSPVSRLRLRDLQSGTWRIDTVCVRLYP